MNRKMLCKVMKAAGHTCEEAEDGAVAVQKVKDKMELELGSVHGYDAILMDFVMPNKDGPTATREIRDLGFGAPIFGVTGNTVDSDIRAFTEAGVNKVFPKPFDVDHFHDLMLSGKDAFSPSA